MPDFIDGILNIIKSVFIVLIQQIKNIFKRPPNNPKDPREHGH